MNTIVQQFFELMYNCPKDTLACLQRDKRCVIVELQVLYELRSACVITAEEFDYMLKLEQNYREICSKIENYEHPQNTLTRQ